MKPLQFRSLAALLLIAAAVPACIADADTSIEEEWVDETSEAVSTTNVALGRPVTVIGQVSSASNPAVVTDGIFADERHWPWNDSIFAVELLNTVPPSSLVVTLAQGVPISKVILQADCNDHYRVDGSLDGATWRKLYDYGPIDGGNGLMTRPSTPLQYTPHAKYIKITPYGGDGLYSISEVQVLTPNLDCCSPYPTASCPMNITCPYTS